MRRKRCLCRALLLTLAKGCKSGMRSPEFGGSVGGPVNGRVKWFERIGYPGGPAAAEQHSGLM